MRVAPKSCQIPAARALLGMEQRQLAELAEVSVSTVIRIEGAGWGPIPGNWRTIERVLEALEKRGVKFTELGVELTKRPRGGGR